jgi:hypothetical protein
MDYYAKYLKYKSKYINLQKNMIRINRHIGGLIKRNENFRYITSIGFELETNNLVPIIVKEKVIRPYGFNSITGSVTKIEFEIEDFDRDEINTNFQITQDSYHLDEELELIKKKQFNDLSSGFILSSYLQQNIDIETEKKNILTIDRDNQDSTYGNLEFIITYRKITPNDNIFYDKMMKIYDFLNAFVKNLRIVDTFEIIKSDMKGKFNIYQFADNELYFISDVPQEHFDLIQFTPQITIGCDIENVHQVLEQLIDDYCNYINDFSFRDKFNLIQDIILSPFFGDYTNFIYISNYVMIVYFFLNVSDITDYQYDPATNNIDINRDTIKIKIRHKFYDVLQKLLQNPEYSKEFNDFIGHISQEHIKQQIKNIRIKYINNLIAIQLTKIDRSFIKKIRNLKDSDNLWGDLNKHAIIQLLKEKKIGIFMFDNIDEILDKICNADYHFLSGKTPDEINSGGTRFDYTNSLLFELRYISSKNAMVQTIDNTIRQLNIINTYEDEHDDKSRRV